MGSFNLVKYVTQGGEFDYNKFRADISFVVRAMDNVVDEATYPMTKQEEEARNKRRMGLGVTGLANTLERCGFSYASDEFIKEENKVLKTLRDECYRASMELAKEKGPFPLFDRDKYLQGRFIKRLPKDIRDGIAEHGIRNSHLTSIAPTGTISLSADNVSSGIEPVFTYGYTRTIQTFDGPIYEDVTDYAYREWGVKGRKADDIEVEDHVKVLVSAQKYVDSACSKTCNVGPDVTWDRFKDVYMQAYEGGAKGCTTFRASGKRYGILNEKKEEESGAACVIDTTTGQPTCS